MSASKQGWQGWRFFMPSRIVPDEAGAALSPEEEATLGEAGQGNEADAPQPTKKKRHWLRWLLLVLIAVPVLVAGAIVAMIQTEAGTKTFWTVAKVLSAGQLQADWRSGSLAHGGSASEVHVHLAKYVHVDITNLSGEWSWAYLPLKWSVERIAADTVDVTMYPKPEDNTPLEKVTLPLSIDAKRVQVATVNLINGLKTTSLINIDGSVSTDQRHHQINLTHLTQGSAEYTGQLAIDGLRPFALTGKVQAVSQYEDNDYSLDVSATGDLYHLNLDVNANGGSVKQPLKGVGQLEVQLLDRYYIHRGHVAMTHFNPYAFWDKLLKADLDVMLEATPQTINIEENKGTENRQPVHGNWRVINHAPAALSVYSLPVDQVSGEFDLTKDQQNVKNIDIQVSGNGRITGAGVWKDKQGDFKFAVNGFDLKNVHPKMSATRLSGPLELTVTKSNQHIVTTLTNSGSNALQVFADVNVTNERVEVTQARVSGSANAKIELKGQLKYTEGLPFEGKAQLLQFNLAELGDFPNSRLAGDFDVNGVVKPNVKVNLKGQLTNSAWAGVPAQGKIDVSYNAPDTFTARELDVTVGGNKFYAKGALGITKDSKEKINVNIDAPNLEQLQFGFGGSLVAKADLTGSMLKPRGVVDATASNLKIGTQSVHQATLKGEWNSGAQGVMSGKLDVQGYLNGLIKLDALNLEVNGTQAAHQFNGKIQGNVLIREGVAAREVTKSGQVLKTAAQPPVQWILNATTQGSGHISDAGWHGQISQFNNQGQPNIVLQHPAQVAYEKGELQFKNLDAQVQNAQVSLDSLNILGARINSRGRVSNLVIPEWLTWLNVTLPFYTDMTIKGDWDMAMGDSPSGGFKFEREKGDLSLDKRQKNTIALSQLVLNGRLSGRTLAITGNLNSDRLGKVDINGNVGMIGSPAGWVITGISPLSLNAKAQMDQLQQFNSLLGANIRLNGQMQADIHIGGALAAPAMSGVLTGQHIDFLHVEQGFRLKDGVIRLNLTDSYVDFEQFDFNGVEGKLSVRGQASYGAGGRLLTAEVTMDKLRPFVRLDRQLILSGQAELGYDGVSQLQIKGKVRADKALIDLPPTLPPSLGDDVVVCSTNPEKSRNCKITNDKASATARLGIVPSIDLTLDLGDNFRFKGQGADVKLVGNVHLESNQGSPLRTTGVVRVESGTYKFYGQLLKVDRGLITFQGPMDDPALNMLATRSVSSTEVGVELTGTLADSKARLISTPEMPDEEKLSWLLFGRSSSTLSTSDGSAIAGAAAILLGSDQGRKVTEKLGIDSFNLGASDSGLTGTVVGVGKRLSDRFTVAYEQGLASVAGVVKVTWTLSRNWQILLRGGSINGMDVQYSRRFDKF